MSILHQQYLNTKAIGTQIHHENIIKFKQTFLAGQQTAAEVLQASDLYY